MSLIPNWREAWKWFSVQALAAIVAIPFVWASLPSDLKAYVPDGAEPWVLMAIAMAGIIGRIVDQNKAAA